VVAHRPGRWFLLSIRSLDNPSGRCREIKINQNDVDGNLELGKKRCRTTKTTKNASVTSHARQRSLGTKEQGQPPAVSTIVILLVITSYNYNAKRWMKTPKHI
jgi:hypothetical protein